MKNNPKFSLTFSLNGILICMLLITLSCVDEPVAVIPSDSATTSIADDKNADNARGSQETFTAQMIGANERPTPIVTHAKGQAVFKLSKDGMSLSYKVIVHNIKNVTQAHIHCGDTETAGPVIAFLFGFTAEGVTVNGVLAEGVITNANIIPRADSEACSGGVADFNDLLEKIQAGEAYINVHTIANPSGEIRGQIN